MVKRSGKIISIIMVLSLMMGAYAFGEGSCAGPGMHGKMFKKMFKGLELNRGQKEQLKQHFKKTKEAEKEIRKEMKLTRNRLREELGKKDLSTKEVDVIVEEMKYTSAKAIEQRVKGLIQVREILSKDQYEEFMEKMKEHRSDKKHRASHKKRHKDLQ